MVKMIVEQKSWFGPSVELLIVSLAENFPLIKEILGWSCQNEELAKN